MIDHPAGAREEAPRCSAKGCQTPAVWAIRWRNPKIHASGRRKIWLACDDHRASLSDFLGRREFPRDVVPLADLDDTDFDDTDVD
jgi:hypothetical protein